MDLAAEFQRRFLPILNAERERREDAFLDPPCQIAGADVLPFTLRHWALLDAIRSPLLTAADPYDSQAAELLHGYLLLNPMELARALWVMSSEQEKAHHDARPWQWHQQNFIKRLDSLFADHRQVSKAARVAIEHVQSAFADAPKGDGTARKQPLASHFAYVIHNLASHYHWPECYILRQLPLARLWQYLRLIEKANDPDVIGSNPSDIPRGQIFDELVQKQRAAENNHREIYFPPTILN